MKVTDFTLKKMCEDVFGLDKNYTLKDLNDAYQNAECENFTLKKDAYFFLKKQLEQNDKKVNISFPDDYISVNNALEVLKLRIIFKYMCTMTTEEMIKEKEKLKGELSEFDLNDKTKLDYFSNWNKYDALKHYLDSEDKKIKKL